MTFSMFLGDCLKRLASYNPSTNRERKGQMVMNDLYKVRPDLFNSIVMDAPGVDPFHVDANIPDFFSWLADHW